jgi:hypothetical protein
MSFYRYLYRSEVFGAFFVTLAIWKLLDFFQQPTVRIELLASAPAGLYLISHGYIIPFIPCVISIINLFGHAEKRDVFNRFSAAVEIVRATLSLDISTVAFPFVSISHRSRTTKANTPSILFARSPLSIC